LLQEGCLCLTGLYVDRCDAKCLGNVTRPRHFLQAYRGEFLRCWAICAWQVAFSNSSGTSRRKGIICAAVINSLSSLTFNQLKSSMETVVFSTILYFMIGLAGRNSVANFFIFEVLVIAFAFLMNQFLSIYGSFASSGGLSVRYLLVWFHPSIRQVSYLFS
jgi:hypothetical protein